MYKISAIHTDAVLSSVKDFAGNVANPYQNLNIN